MVARTNQASLALPWRSAPNHAPPVVRAFARGAALV